MKNSSDTILNRTRDLPVCSAVPQPTAPPRTYTTRIIILCGQKEEFLSAGLVVHKVTPGLLMLDV